MSNYLLIDPIPCGRSIGKPFKKRSKKEEVEKYSISFSQLMRLNSPEWKFLVVGCIAAMMHGATFPVWAVFFGDFFGVNIYEPKESV